MSQCADGTTASPSPLPCLHGLARAPHPPRLPAAGSSQADLLLLARELRAVGPRSPEAWIASGNLFSLRKDHTTALRHFQHAAAADPAAHYAYTLCGYELMYSGDEDGAAKSFRSAIARHPRHFTAWAGLVSRPRHLSPGQAQRGSGACAGAVAVRA